jgi:hypothetical protein
VNLEGLGELGDDLITLDGRRSLQWSRGKSQVSYADASHSAKIVFVTQGAHLVMRCVGGFLRRFATMVPMRR